MEGLIRVLSVHLENFASYKELDFDFVNQGLTLIHGPTGAGKSTLCDAIPWIIWGRTAKNGAVDEILSWNGGITKGAIIVGVTHHADIRDNQLLGIVRKRGANAKDNDLYWYYAGARSLTVYRGKDLNDTQKLINQLLGIDIDLYLAGAYYHEFSQTAQFFTTSAKNRRIICEQLVDLNLPKKLTEKAASKIKELKDKLGAYELNSGIIKSTIELVKINIESTEKDAIFWDSDKIAKLAALSFKSDRFEDEKETKVQVLKAKLYNLDVKDADFYLKQIKQLRDDMPPESEKCSTCGAPKENEKIDEIKSQIQELDKKHAVNIHQLKQYDSLLAQIEEMTISENTYALQIEETKAQKNPHNISLRRYKAELNGKKDQLEDLEDNNKQLLQDKTDLELLADAVVEFRRLLIQNTILNIEEKTNVLLCNHFDAEIRIELSAEDSDKLEVSIFKDGNNASFTQLSKGQRQMLKLCFGCAVMEAVSNHHGVNFSQIFVDEALDGLDDDKKMKAINLLETVALNKAVYVVEHSETVKALVDNKIKVELINGQSEITEKN